MDFIEQYETLSLALENEEIDSVEFYLSLGAERGSHFDPKHGNDPACKTCICAAGGYWFVEDHEEGEGPDGKTIYPQIPDDLTPDICWSCAEGLEENYRNLFSERENQLIVGEILKSENA